MDVFSVSAEERMSGEITTHYRQQKVRKWQSKRNNRYENGMQRIRLLPYADITKPLNMNPMNRLPESPRKIDAGLKLNTRKPRFAPAKIVTANAEPSTSIHQRKGKNRDHGKQCGAGASPSRPSIKLMALQMKTTHPTVNVKQIPSRALVMEYAVQAGKENPAKIKNNSADNLRYQFQDRAQTRTDRQ